jgi:hypothetical protein
MGWLRITDSTLAWNTAFYGGGGALFNGRGGTVVVRDTRIRHNRAEAFGGGILDRGMLVLRDTAVTANTAGRRGGGLFVAPHGTAEVRAGSTVEGNQPDDCAGTSAC